MPENQLRDLVDAYLRSSPDWKEHPEYAGSYRQWEDVLAKEGDRKMLPTDLAAVRQIVREGLALREAKSAGGAHGA